MILSEQTDTTEIIRMGQQAIALVKAAPPESTDAFTPVDTVWPLIETLPADTEEIKNIRAHFLYYRSFSNSRKGLFDEAIAHAIEARRLFEELAMENQQAAVINAIGLLHLSKGQYTEALDIYTSNLASVEQLGNRSLISQIYKNIGRIYWNLGNNNEAIVYTQKSLSIAETLSNQKALISAYMNMGNMYASVDDLGEAFQHYIKGLELVEQHYADHLHTRAQFLMNIGAIFLRMGDYDRALEYNLRSLTIQEKLDRPVELARLYGNISELYKERREFSLARHYLLLADTMYTDLQLHHERSHILTLLAHIVLAMDEPEAALKYASESRDIARTNNDIRKLVAALHAIARVLLYNKEYDRAFRHLCEAKELYSTFGSSTEEIDIRIDMAAVLSGQNRIDEALEHLLTADALANDKHKEKPLVAKVRYMLAETYEQAGNTALALHYFKAFRELEKMIFNEKSEYKIYTLKILHEVEEAHKETEIHRLKSEQLQREMEHLQHDLVVHALHLAQRHELLHKIKRSLTTMNKSAMHNLRQEVWNVTRIVDKALVKSSKQPESRKDELHKVRHSLTVISTSLLQNVHTEVQTVLQNIDGALTDETMWEQFTQQYKQVHGRFLDILTATFPRLSATELKVCALIHINMSSKEIGRILNISSRSVDTYRYNIRQKLDLSPETNLAQYMTELAQQHR
jgi:tetratricopeptide (TPR) repeat protein/DNA-binding CsgD family transcriptional regulator